MKLFKRVLVISTLMVLSSISLTGVGYAGAEGVAMVAIHAIWAVVAAHFANQYDIHKRALDIAAAESVELDKKLKASELERMGLAVNYQLAMNKISTLESEINTRQWGNMNRGDRDARNRDFADYAAISTARTTLGLRGLRNTTTKDVMKAYHKLVREDHPDNGGTGKNISKYQEARDILVRAYGERSKV